MKDAYPVLYSFRRCPYAMRARMALLYSGVRVELREVVLRAMPPALLACSPKGTVPVLVLPNGDVIDESLDIMHRALAINDPQRWLPADRPALLEANGRLIGENDHVFKQHLDHYKYAERYPQQPRSVYRARGEVFLQKLEQRLAQSAWLTNASMGVADVAIFPFIRQFAFVDKPWFDSRPLPRLQAWLAGMLDSALFSRVMQKYPPWKEGDAMTVFPE
jgi:glutathione S-transferase